MVEEPETLRIGILHGPNLNLLGTREPERYGSIELAEIDRRIERAAAELGASTESYQSNVEGELVSWIQDAPSHFDGLLVNAAAYTHTSVAIRDALLAIRLPFVEVHLTNILARESFRQRSLLSDIAIGVVSGFGPDSYLLALRGLLEYLRRT